MSKAHVLGMQNVLRRLVPFAHQISGVCARPAGLCDKERALFASYALLATKVVDLYRTYGAQPQAIVIGSKFDPGLHLKVAEVKPTSEQQTPGTILEVLKHGWNLSGSVLV